LGEPTAVACEPRTRSIALPGRGGEIAAYEFGPAERPIDVLFSHANGFNARTYRTILGPLSDRLRILATDLRGHGRTRLPLVIEGRTSWTETRDDLLAILDELDLEDVVLAGHSMGGTLSLLAAAQAPQRARAVVMFDPVILPQALIDRAKAGEMLHGPLVEQALRRRTVFPDRDTAYRAYHGRGAFKTWSDAMLADYVADGFRETADGQVELACPPSWEASSYGAQGNDTWDAFRATLCPIRTFLAEHGSPSARRGKDPAAIDPRRIEITLVPGTTHFLPMERPDVVQQALRAAAG
jgi:pimeloyl-ACP methyl ester carboxylesterase